MTKGRGAALLPLAAAVLAACGGSGGGDRAAAAADTPATHRVWTPDQARALRQARERGEAAPQAVPVPGPSEGQDSAQWAAEENAKYAERVRSMQPYTSCMAQARAATDAELRTRIEEGCRRLPTAPR